MGYGIKWVVGRTGPNTFGAESTRAERDGNCLISPQISPQSPILAVLSSHLEKHRKPNIPIVDREDT